MKGTGPIPAEMMIVGEAWGADEERKGEPFVGRSGEELTRMLHDAGIIRRDCYLTNITNSRPKNNEIEHFFTTNEDVKLGHYLLEVDGLYPEPDILVGLWELKKEIAAVNPNVIVAFGNTALWALTGKGNIANSYKIQPGRKMPTGITDWRGSFELLREDLLPSARKAIKVIPAVHPAFILRTWEWRRITVHDLRRAASEMDKPGYARPVYNFTIRPGFNDVMWRLAELITRANRGPLRIAADMETRGRRFIACLGIAWSKHDAICIPFMCVERPRGYWELDEELAIVERITELFSHPNVQLIGQNWLYDVQYQAHHWGTATIPYMDTMLAQHTCFPSGQHTDPVTGKKKGAFTGIAKSLDFIASMYSDFYQYWKAEGKDWDPKKMPEDQLWEYNCKDSVYTYEASYPLERTIKAMKVEAPYAQQKALFEPVMHMMLRGVLIDKKARSAVDLELQEAMSDREQYFIDVLGHPLNPRSPLQMKALFYDDFGLPVQYKRGKRGERGNPTLDDDALSKLARIEPLVAPLIQCIQEHRSCGTVLSNAVRAPLDPDGRMRCSLNIAGTETFRFSSSENAFGRGTNLQNITQGVSRKKREADHLSLPNLRKMFIPDPGKTIMEWDLEKADVQIVAWESGDEVLKAIFKEGYDLHTENAKAIFGTVNKNTYHMAKQGVHLTDYGGSANRLAEVLGITRHEAERFQKTWFDAHPAIKRWHNDVEMQLQTTRTVENKFGYRRKYFGRIDGLLPEALAWIPQSSVAVAINKGLLNIWNNMREDVELLLQVHDSLVMQCKASRVDVLAPKIRENLLIPIPYDDPLTIPVTCKTSTRSWGHIEDYELKEAA